MGVVGGGSGGGGGGGGAGAGCDCRSAGERSEVASRLVTRILFRFQFFSVYLSPVSPVLVPVRASHVPSVVRGALYLEHLECRKKERKKTDNPREGWEDGLGVGNLCG